MLMTSKDSPAMMNMVSASIVAYKNILRSRGRRNTKLSAHRKRIEYESRAIA